MNMQHAISTAEIAGEAIRDAAPPTLSQPLHALLAALDGRGVRYCHWKSNIRLAQALTGKEDLDLLVHREDAGPFQAALAEAGFKRAASRAGLGHPGVFHALALDEAMGRLVHVHAYVQIVGGDSLVKSYRLPIETLLLSDRRLLHGLPVPAPEVELAVFALRIALKHAGPVEAAMANRDYRGVVEELAWLRGQADEEQASRLFTALVPEAGPALFSRLLEAIGSERALGRRLLLGSLLAWRLRGLRRLGPVAAIRSRLRRVAALAARRLSRRKDMVLETGGHHRGPGGIEGDRQIDSGERRRAAACTATRRGADPRRETAGHDPFGSAALVPAPGTPLIFERAAQRLRGLRAAPGAQLFDALRSTHDASGL
ncbi:hypothetical protein [Siccirubricoccus sp. G192]|uniref:hypothetical protein n=1 Tax=Siccirubricoccus sp. G192 TaxID=2849651 RepID=UPI001C2C4973|nr:hypothetical protein [Siccirubricoccus sp. G192]MBV1797542.1 hypothetical protein [Siccirubricoccus sp. G192]